MARVRIYDKAKATTIMAVTLSNVVAAFSAAEATGLHLQAACALLEKESHGQNRWGNDAGGVFSGLPLPVTRDAFRAFLWEVRENGRTSNGVGPCQITYPGHFDVMESRGLQAWNPLDNMTYGFGLLKADFDAAGGDWVKAGTAYNGSHDYGVDLADKIHIWRDKLAPAAW